MTVLGITGPTGAGKTTLLREVENLGGGVIDCDEVYHQLLEGDSALQDALEKEFGPLREGAGPIDRKRLGAIVFGDAGKLEVLNAIAWRAVVEHTQELIQAHRAQGKVLAAVDAIALLECPLRELCFQVVPDALGHTGEARHGPGGHISGLCLGSGQGAAAGRVFFPKL